MESGRRTLFKGSALAPARGCGMSLETPVKVCYKTSVIKNTEANVMDIGKRITSARAAANLTQQELADKLFVSRDLVAKWEQGRRRPDYGTIVSIAEALSIPPDKLIDKNECVFRELKACVRNGVEIPSDKLPALISRFLRERPQREADLFIRKYYLLESNAEIALRYGMEQNQVRSRLSKTAKKLGRFLKEECENERY